LREAIYSPTLQKQKEQSASRDMGTTMSGFASRAAAHAPALTNPPLPSANFPSIMLAEAGQPAFGA